MSTTIVGIDAWEALDSRARPTVACTVHVSGGASGTALSPTGASTGQFEAPILRDGGDRYGGDGVRSAVAEIRRLLPELIDTPAVEIDNLLSGPSNVTLPLSIAAAKATAAAGGVSLWRSLAERTNTEPALPCPMINIFSGGRHAEGGGTIQDFLAVPLAASSIAEAIHQVWAVRRAAAELLGERYGRLAAALVADEGGLAVPDGSDEVALETLAAAIDRVGFPVGIAIDVAATQVNDPDALLDSITAWTNDFPIVSVEDPADDDDWAGWERATKKLGHLQLVGDDLFATNSVRVALAAARGVANTVLVKCDQIGTLDKARETVETARSYGMATVVSARSGETEDPALADIAVGWNGGQIKVGSLMRSERLAKYNRLLEIETLANLPYAGWPR